MAPGPSAQAPSGPGIVGFMEVCGASASHSLPKSVVVAFIPPEATQDAIALLAFFFFRVVPRSCLDQMVLQGIGSEPGLLCKKAQVQMMAAALLWKFIARIQHP